MSHYQDILLQTQWRNFSRLSILIFKTGSIEFNYKSLINPNTPSSTNVSLSAWMFFKQSLFSLPPNISNQLTRWVTLKISGFSKQDRGIFHNQKRALKSSQLQYDTSLWSMLITAKRREEEKSMPHNMILPNLNLDFRLSLAKFSDQSHIEKLQVSNHGSIFFCG